MAAAVVSPHPLIWEVVEVEILQMLELGACRREQFLGQLDEIVHRPTDVEKQQHLHRIVPLRHKLQVECASILRGGSDCVRQVELCCRALSRETPKSAQRQFKIASTLLYRVVK